MNNQVSRLKNPQRHNKNTNNLELIKNFFRFLSSQTDGPRQVREKVKTNHSAREGEPCW